MSDSRPFTRPVLNEVRLPDGQTVGSFTSYQDARAAVDLLARNDGFSVESTSIVGRDLESVERVTGRMSAGRAALSGFASGAMIGVFVGLMWLVLYPETNLGSLLAVMLVSIGFGVIWSMVRYAFTGRRGEFTSVMQILASRYDVVVPDQLAGQARQILAAGPAQAHAPHAAPGSTAANAPATPPASSDAAPASSREHGSEGAGEPTAPPAAPAGPPRTYGELVDEQRRRAEAQARERSASGPDTSGPDTAGPDTAGSNASGS